MAVRRLNYTKRKRIARNDVNIRLQPLGEGRSVFHAELRLGDYALPDSGQVFVEARQRSTLMRFDWGRIGKLVEPADRTLSAFSMSEGMTFRVVVADADGRPGLLLAEADQIAPSDPATGEAGKLSLLSVQPDDGLGEAAWRLDFVQGPKLLINRKVGDWRSFASTPAFKALVYPAIVREVLRAVYDAGGPDDENLADWKTRWMMFGRSLTQASEVPSPGPEYVEEQQLWIEEVVSAFCTRYRLFNQMAEAGGVQ